MNCRYRAEHLKPVNDYLGGFGISLYKNGTEESFKLESKIPAPIAINIILWL